MDSINIVIATTFRESLTGMLNSVYDQLSENDYITVINDSYESPNLRVGPVANGPTIINLSTRGKGFWGHGARNAVQDILPGNWLMHADDDDIYLPGAIDAVRQAVKGGEKLYLFKFENKRNATIYWLHEKHFINNVGTPCGVIPNKPPFPQWGSFYGGDGAFYASLAERFAVEWVDHVIYQAN